MRFNNKFDVLCAMINRGILPKDTIVDQLVAYRSVFKEGERFFIGRVQKTLLAGSPIFLDVIACVCVKSGRVDAVTRRNANTFGFHSLAATGIIGVVEREHVSIFGIVDKEMCDEYPALAPYLVAEKTDKEILEKSTAGTDPR